MRIAVGADHAGFPLKGPAIEELRRLGHEVLEAMVGLGMALDVAHASPTALADMFSHANARPFSSHTGAQGATPSWRNLPDAALKTNPDDVVALDARTFVRDDYAAAIGKGQSDKDAEDLAVAHVADTGRLAKLRAGDRDVQVRHASALRRASRYAEARGWRVEILSENAGENG
jgi:microsomal dipeptidase-like Zn-dependent dipeptidase